MHLDKVYNFLFHPEKERSSSKKAFSIITIVALSIITGGGFLLAFGITRLCERKIRPVNTNTSSAQVFQGVHPSKSSNATTTQTPTNLTPIQNTKPTLETKPKPIAAPLTQVELNRLIGGKPCPFTFHEQQLPGGQCGRHVINNAIGRPIEDDSFRQKVQASLQKKLGFKIDMSADDFGVDPETLREILREGELHAETKSAPIQDLPGFAENKEKALLDYVGEANWLIAYNGGAKPHPMPSKSKATYPAAAGHLIAARKDSQGQWWIIDSRTPWMLDVPLSTLGDQFTLIVPTNQNKESAKIQHLKVKHAEQLKDFEAWAAAGHWGKFADAHYDWWMFPINRSSQGQGNTYAINSAEIAQLKADPVFMQRYRRGVELVVKSWGWDLNQNRPLTSPTADQKWIGYGVRLGKMGDSLLLFGEKELYKKVQNFYRTVCVPYKIPLEPWIHQIFAK